MGFTYEKTTEAYVKFLPIGKIFTSVGLRKYILKINRKKIGPGKAADLLDDCICCEAIRDGSMPRRWKRVL